jgi:hypothetical protein
MRAIVRKTVRMGRYGAGEECFAENFGKICPFSEFSAYENPTLPALGFPNRET